MGTQPGVGDGLPQQSGEVSGSAVKKDVLPPDITQKKFEFSRLSGALAVKATTEHQGTLKWDDIFPQADFTDSHSYDMILPVLGKLFENTAPAYAIEILAQDKTGVEGYVNVLDSLWRNPKYRNMAIDILGQARIVDFNGNPFASSEEKKAFLEKTWNALMAGRLCGVVQGVVLAENNVQNAKLEEIKYDRRDIENKEKREGKKYPELKAPLNEKAESIRQSPKIPETQMGLVKRVLEMFAPPDQIDGLLNNPDSISSLSDVQRLFWKSLFGDTVPKDFQSLKDAKIPAGIRPNVKKQIASAYQPPKPTI